MKSFKYLLLGSCLFLGACGPDFAQRFSDTISVTQHFSISQAQLDSARNSYDGAVLAPLNKYASLPRCRTGQTLTVSNPCHDRVLLKKIRTVDVQILRAFNNTQDRITSGDNKGSVSAYGSLQDAIALAKSLIEQSGIHILGI